MRQILLISLFLFNWNCSSQKYCNNFDCKFENGNIEIFTQNVKDTVFSKITLRNKVSEKFSASDIIRISYKKRKNDIFSEPYDLYIEKVNEMKDENVVDLYKIFESCLLEYQKYFFKNNKKQINELYANSVSNYYYRVNLMIFPKD